MIPRLYPFAQNPSALLFHPPLHETALIAALQHRERSRDIARADNVIKVSSSDGEQEIDAGLGGEGMRIIVQNLRKNFGMSSWPANQFACVGEGWATDRLDETKAFWVLSRSKVSPRPGKGQSVFCCLFDLAART